MDRESVNGRIYPLNPSWWSNWGHKITEFCILAVYLLYYCFKSFPMYWEVIRNHMPGV